MVAKLNRVKQLKNDYEITFNSAEGQRVLHDIIVHTHVLVPTFTDDPYRTAFNEGSRNEALRIMSILQYKPQDFVRIAQEISDE